MQAISSIRPATAALRSVTVTGSAASAAASPAGRRPAALAVLEVATALEPDPAKAVAWYVLVPIAELGQLTAGELVAQGRGEAVLAFLRAVIEGRRG